MRFLINTQLPKVLARRLKESGHACEHVLDHGLGQSSDNTIWNFALENEFVILSKDDDFAEWILSGRPRPRVVWRRIGNCTNDELLGWLAPVWPRVIESLKGGDRLVEVS